MSVPVSHLIVEEAHKELNSLADEIAAKYEQLDSSDFEAVGTPAFNAKSAKLASHFARISQLCQKLNLPIPAQLHRLLGQNYRQAVLVRVWRMQLCSHTYVRITGLLSAPLVLRIGDWLCILLANPL